MPFGLVTVTATVPVPAGATAVIRVPEMTVNEFAAVAPNFTAVVPANPVPVRTTVLPPAAGPEWGLTENSDGTAR